MPRFAVPIALASVLLAGSPGAAQSLNCLDLLVQARRDEHLRLWQDAMARHSMLRVTATRTVVDSFTERRSTQSGSAFFLRSAWLPPVSVGLLRPDDDPQAGLAVMALGRTRMLCGRDPASSDHARIAVFPVQGTQLSVDYVDARFAEALEPSNWVPFLLDVNASDLARRYQIRLVKEDQWYAYLAIRPNVVLDDPWYAYFSFRPNKVLVGDRFDRAGVVLLKESHRPRQIWVHEHGNQTIWNLTKVEGW